MIQISVKYFLLFTIFAFDFSMFDRNQKATEWVLEKLPNFEGEVLFRRKIRLFFVGKLRPVSSESGHDNLSFVNIIISPCSNFVHPNQSGLAVKFPEEPIRKRRNP